MKNLLYKPENYPGPIAKNATLGVKFANDTFLLESFLIQQKIKYKIEDLEKTPFGLALRIKRDKEQDK